MGRGQAQIEITASSSRLAAGLAAASAKFKSFSGTIARGIGGAFKKAGGDMMGKVAGGNILSNLAGAGTGAILDAANEVRNFERNLTRFQIATNGSAASTDALRKQIRQVSKETAIGSDQILAGASQYVALTGDAAGASQAMSSFARIAQASGSSVEDVASATAALKTSMGLDAKDIEAAFSGMIVQGKAGAVEIKDMAGELAELAPQFAQFRGGQGLSGIRDMGAAFQVIRQGAGSASGAATQFQSLMGAIAKPEVIKKLNKLKIKIFDKDPATGLKTMRSASDIFEDLAKNQALSDPSVVAGIFGDKEARAALRSIRGNIAGYRELSEAAKDTGAVQRDLDTYMNSSSGKIDKALNQVKASFAEAFTPERIEAVAGALAKVADMLVKVIGMAEQAASSLDFEGGAARMLAKHEVDRARAEKLSPAQAAARADQLEAKAAKIQGDDMKSNVERRGYLQAANDLRAQASKDDSWVARSVGFDPMKFIAKAAELQTNPQQAVKDAVGGSSLARDLLVELQKITANTAAGTKVEIDGNKVAKASRNATINRGGRH